MSTRVQQHDKRKATVAEVEKSKRGPCVPSRKVFLSCVKYDSNNVPDVSLIFSKEGLQRWLASRGVEIMHPEQSYQRVLYAHIRGADKRTPFPEEVEKALLSTLRNENNIANPWKNVLGHQSKRKFGIKGFRQKGFHERKREYADQANNKCTVTKKKILKYPTSLGDGIGKSTADIQLQPTALVPSQHNNWRINVTKNFPVTPYDLVMNAFSKYMEPEHRRTMMAAAESRGVPVSSPALVYLLSEQPDRSDPRFDINFLLPTKDQQKFKPVVSRETLIGGLYFDATWVCIGEDPEIHHIMRGSMLGKHGLEFAGSLISEYIAKIKELKEFYLGGGVIWRRYPMKRADGSRGVYLFRAEPFNKERTISYIRYQDVSADYPEVISRISFI